MPSKLQPQLVFLLAVCGLAAVQATPLRFHSKSWHGAAKMIWKDSGSKGADVKDVYIRPWDSSDNVAAMHQGSSYNITVVFEATKPASHAVTHVFGKLKASPRMEWPLPHPNACGDPIGTVTCPIQMGKQYIYRKNVAVSSYYPPWQYVVYWELHNEKDEPIFAVVFPLRIIRPKSSKQMDHVISESLHKLVSLKSKSAEDESLKLFS